MQPKTEIPFAGPRAAAKLSTLPTASRLPTRQALVDIGVERVEPIIGIAGTEVVAPATENRIEPADDISNIARCGSTMIGQLMDTRSDLLHRFRRRPSLHEVPVGHSLNAPALPNGAA